MLMTMAEVPLSIMVTKSNDTCQMLTANIFPFVKLNKKLSNIAPVNKLKKNPNNMGRLNS